MGRPLFSGLRDLPWPSNPIGVLWRSCELAREHRGDGHIAVCLSEGLDPVKMNVLTELFVGMPLGSYSASRAWSADQIADAADDLRTAGLIDDDGLTAAGLDYRREIEARTDALDQPLVDAIGDLDAMLGPLRTWSQRCIDAARSRPIRSSAPPADTHPSAGRRGRRQQLRVLRPQVVEEVGGVVVGVEAVSARCTEQAFVAVNHPSGDRWQRSAFEFGRATG